MVNFTELNASFELTPAEAFAFFIEKGLRQTFAWQEMVAEEHIAAFTVAKMMDNDLLGFVQEKLTDAIAEGTTLEKFAAAVVPELESAGWWGKGASIDPATGNIVTTQLGSASRLETIFRSNMQSAYSVGTWQEIKTNADFLPYLMYDAVDDDRVRPEHGAWDGLVYPVDHPFWQKHYPPNGWNCRCSVIQMDGEDVAEFGLEIGGDYPQQTYSWTNPRTGIKRDVPVGVDPGWDFNPGEVREESLRRLAAEKSASMPTGSRGLASKGIKAAQDAGRREAPGIKADPELRPKDEE